MHILRWIFIDDDSDAEEEHAAQPTEAHLTSDLLHSHSESHRNVDGGSGLNSLSEADSSVQWICFDERQLETSNTLRGGNQHDGADDADAPEYDDVWDRDWTAIEVKAETLQSNAIGSKLPPISQPDADPAPLLKPTTAAAGAITAQNSGTTAAAQHPHDLQPQSHIENTSNANEHAEQVAVPFDSVKPPEKRALSQSQPPTVPSADPASNRVSPGLSQPFVVGGFMHALRRLVFRNSTDRNSFREDEFESELYPLPTEVEYRQAGEVPPTHHQLKSGSEVEEKKEPDDLVNKKCANEANLGGTEFEIQIKKSGDAAPLGVKVTFQDDVLRVDEIYDGVLKDWNAANVETQLKPGHRIVEVNGVRNDVPGMTNELKKTQLLVIRVKRCEEGQSLDKVVRPATDATEGPFPRSFLTDCSSPEKIVTKYMDARIASKFDDITALLSDHAEIFSANPITGRVKSGRMADGTMMEYLTSSAKGVTSELDVQPPIQKTTDNGDSWEVFLYFRVWKKIRFVRPQWFHMQATFTVSKAGKIDKIVVTSRSAASLAEVGVELETFDATPPAEAEDLQPQSYPQQQTAELGLSTKMWWGAYSEAEPAASPSQSLQPLQPLQQPIVTESTQPQVEQPLTTSSVLSSRPPAKTNRGQRLDDLLAEPLIRKAALAELVWVGIPEEQQRCEAWRVLLGYLPPVLIQRRATLQKKRCEYQELRSGIYEGSSCSSKTANSSVDLVGSAAALHQIRLDLPRTEICKGNGSSRFQAIVDSDLVQALMERVLFVWSMIEPDAGYVQGMNDILLPLLFVFLSERTGVNLEDDGFCIALVEALPGLVLDEVEADCYWCLLLVLNEVVDYYVPGQPGLRHATELITLQLGNINGPLLENFELNECQGADLKLVAMRWLGCLMVRELPLPLCVRLWDTCIAQSALGHRRGFSDFLVDFIVSFMNSHDKSLRNADFDDLMEFLLRPPSRKMSAADLEMVTAEAYVLGIAAHPVKPASLPSMHPEADSSFHPATPASSSSAAAADLSNGTPEMLKSTEDCRAAKLVSSSSPFALITPSTHEIRAGLAFEEQRGAELSGAGPSLKTSPLQAAEVWFQNKQRCSDQLSSSGMSSELSTSATSMQTASAHQPSSTGSYCSAVQTGSQYETVETSSLSRIASDKPNPPVGSQQIGSLDFTSSRLFVV